MQFLLFLLVGSFNGALGLRLQTRGSDHPLPDKSNAEELVESEIQSLQGLGFRRTGDRTQLVAGYAAAEAMWYSTFRSPACHLTNASHRPGKDLTLIHIPRTGGTTIESCSSHFPDDQPKWGVRNEMILQSPRLREIVGGGKCYTQHMPPQFATRQADVNLYKNRDSNFCVVRNPYDRLISQYGFMHGFFGNAAQGKFLCNAQSMNDQLLLQLKKVEAGQISAADCHYTPQTLFVYGGYNATTRMVDLDDRWCKHTLRFESLVGDFNQLMEQFDYDVRLGKERNGNTASSKDCAALKREELSEDVRLLATKIYKQDFEAFGYSTEV